MKFDPITGKLQVAGGGSPGGSTGQLQFNNGGAFGGDSNLKWDNTNKRLGLAQGTPLQTFDETGILMVRGAFGSGESLNVSGAGARMFFYPKKAAFRAGLFNNEADDANIGNYSAAMGIYSEASGRSSVALGDTSIATGYDAIAIGSENTVSSSGGISLGSNTIYTSETNSTVLGSGNVIEGGGYNSCIGAFNQMGTVTTSNGSTFASACIGYDNIVNAYVGVGIGYAHTIDASCALTAVAIGCLINLTNSPNIGIVGIGGGNINNSTSMVNAYDGTIGIGINADIPTMWVTDWAVGGGYVGIGQTDPTTITEKLQVNGNVKATGYKSSDGSAGITGTMTTASLVGKTLTFKNGIVTGFA